MPSPRGVRRARSRGNVSVPEIRVHACNPPPVRPDGAYVLYWMSAFRRTGWNFALRRRGGPRPARAQAILSGRPARAAGRLGDR